MSESLLTFNIKVVHPYCLFRNNPFSIKPCLLLNRDCNIAVKMTLDHDICHGVSYSLQYLNVLAKILLGSVGDYFVIGQPFPCSSIKFLLSHLVKYYWKCWLIFVLSLNCYWRWFERLLISFGICLASTN